MSEPPIEINASDTLMDEGFDLLEQGQLEEALALGERLERLAWTGGFELQALALNRLDRRDEAIDVLQRGVDEAGGPWLLWQLLGNYLSDETRYDEAHRAYDEALKLDVVDEISIAINRSVLFQRQERYDDALGVLDRVDMEDPDLTPDSSEYWKLKDCRWSVFNDQDRFAEVTKEFETEREQFEKFDEDAEIISWVAYHVGFAFYRLGNIASATRWNAYALAWNKYHEYNAWLLRELRGERGTEATNYYEILIEGMWAETERGFIVNYGVAADSPEKALDFVKEFEPENVHDTLKIDEMDVIEAGFLEPKGVYVVSAYHTYPLDEAEE